MAEQRIDPDNRVAISVEISGSRAVIALVDRAGRVRESRRAKMLWNRPPATTLEPCLRVVDELLMSARAEGLYICGLGCTVPGSLDLVSQRPLLIPSLPALNGFPLKDWLVARYDLPVELSMDVDAALLGEYHFGVGRGLRRLLMLSANVVVGASLVVDGRLEAGSAEYMGHICHFSVSNSGSRCGCGRRGCINTLVTPDAVQKMLQRAVRRGEQTRLLTRLTNHEQLSLQLVAEEAQLGDVVAAQIYSEVSRYLEVAIARYIDLFEPHMLILGGTLSASELLLSGIRTTVNSSSTARVCSIVEVMPALLGRDGALLGAVVALLA